MNTQYLERSCYSCEVTIMVASHDISERYYCQTCAIAKVAYDYRTEPEESDV